MGLICCWQRGSRKPLNMRFKTQDNSCWLMSCSLCWTFSCNRVCSEPQCINLDESHCLIPALSCHKEVKLYETSQISSGNCWSAWGCHSVHISAVLDQALKSTESLCSRHWFHIAQPPVFCCGLGSAITHVEVFSQHSPWFFIGFCTSPKSFCLWSLF